MPSFTVTHEIDCDVDTFWKTFFDDRFNQEFFVKHLGYPEHRTVDRRETDTELFCRVVAMPKLTLPAPVAKLMGDNFRYTEEGVFEKATKLWRWKVVPSTQAGMIRTEGVIRAEPLGPGKVRRVSEATVESRMFGLGGLIERSTERQMRDSWNASAAFMNEYVRRQPRSP